MALNLLNGAFGVGAFLSPLLVLVMERSYASSWQGLQMSFWSVAVCGVCIGIATFTGAKNLHSPPRAIHMHITGAPASVQPTRLCVDFSPCRPGPSRFRPVCSQQLCVLIQTGRGVGIVCDNESDSAVKSPPNPNVSDPREGKRRALGLGWPLSDSSVMLSPRVPGTCEPPPLQQADEERTAVEPLTAIYVMLVRPSILTPDEPLSWNPRLVHTGLRRSWAEAHCVCTPTRATSIPELHFLSGGTKAQQRWLARSRHKGKSPTPRRIQNKAPEACVCA